VQFQLQDAGGHPLKVPAKPPRLLVHRPDAESWRADNPLRAVGVRKNGHAVDPGVLDAKVLALAGSDEYEVAFEIDHVRQTRDGGEVDVPIANGAYKLGAIVTFIDSAHTDHSRILQSALVA